MPDHNERKRFPNISSSAFEHPTDRAALAALKKAPGLDWVFRKFNEYTSDRAAKLYCLSDTVRVDHNQCAELHKMLVECCEILDMPVPQLYIDQHPYANAMTFAVETPIILVYSGLLELLDDDEWRFILGHELGHIKSGHALYRQIARFLARLAEHLGTHTFGIGQTLAVGLFYAFFHWYRQSELTADRAGLLVTQDVEAVVRTQMKLAGGSRKLYAQMNREAFLAQGRDYHEMGKDILNQVFKMGMELHTTHPFLAVRAMEIDAWAKGPEYAALLRGEYSRETRSSSSPAAEAFADTPPDDARKCPNCGSVVLYRAFVFCPNCGADLPRDS